MAVSRSGASSHGLPTSSTATTGGARMAAAAPNNRRRHGSFFSIWGAVVVCLWVNLMILSPLESSSNPFSLVLGVRADDEGESKASEATSGEAEEASGKRNESREPSRRRSKRRSKGGKESEDQSVTADDFSSGDDIAKRPRKGSVRKGTNKPSRRASTRASRDASKSEEAASDKDLEKGEGAATGERKKSKRKSSSGTDEGAAAAPRGERKASRRGSTRKASQLGSGAKRRSTSKVGKQKKDEGKVKEEGNSSKGEDDHKKDEGKESKRKGSTSKGKGDRKKSKSKKGISSRKEGKDESKDELFVVSTDADSTTDADSASTTGSEGGKSRKRSSTASRRTSKRGKSSKNDDNEDKASRKGGSGSSKRRYSSRKSSQKEGEAKKNTALPEASSTGESNDPSFDLSSILGPKLSTSPVAEGDSASEDPLSDPTNESLLRSLDPAEGVTGAPVAPEDFSTSLESAAIDSLLQSNDGVPSGGGPLGGKKSGRASRGGSSRNAPGRSSRKKGGETKHEGGRHPKESPKKGKGGRSTSKDSIEETATSLPVFDPLVVDSSKTTATDGDLSQSVTGVGEAGLVAGEASPQPKETTDQERGMSSLALWKKLARGETVDKDGLRRASERGRLGRELKRDEKGLSLGDNDDLGLSKTFRGEDDFSSTIASSSSRGRRRRRHERRAEKDAEATAKLEKRRRREEEEREHLRRMQEEEIYDEFDEEFGYRAGGHNWLLPGPPIVVPPGSWPLRGLLFPDPDLLKQDVQAQRRIASAARELAAGPPEQTPVESSEVALRRAAGTTAEIFESRFPFGTRFTFQPRHGHSFEPKVLTRGRFIRAGEEALIFEVWDGNRRWALRLRLKHVQDFQSIRGAEEGEQQPSSSSSSAFAGLVNSEDDVKLSPSSSSSISLLRRGASSEDSLGKKSLWSSTSSLSLSPRKASPASRDLEAWEKFSDLVCNECEAQEKFAGKILLSTTTNEQPRDLFIRERIALPVAVGEIATLPSLSLLREDLYITNVAGLYPLAQASVKDLVDNYDLPADVKLELARQMIEVVARLHSRGVVHMSLKLGHFLVDRDGYLFLADFSTAEKITEGEERMESACASASGGGAPLVTLSPEQLSCWLPSSPSVLKTQNEEVGRENKKEKKTTHFYPTMSVDSWGLGVSLVELWCGEIPFRVPPSVKKMSQYAVAKYLSELHRRHHGRLDLGACPEGDISHSELKRLIEGLLAYEAEKRWLPLDVVFTSPVVADASLLQGNLLKQSAEPPTQPLTKVTMGRTSPDQSVQQSELEQEKHRHLDVLSPSDGGSSVSFADLPPYKKARKGGSHRRDGRGRRRGSRGDGTRRRGRDRKLD